MLDIRKVLNVRTVIIYGERNRMRRKETKGDIKDKSEKGGPKGQ